MNPYNFLCEISDYRTIKKAYKNARLTKNKTGKSEIDLLKQAGKLHYDLTKRKTKKAYNLEKKYMKEHPAKAIRDLSLITLAATIPVPGSSTLAVLYHAKNLKNLNEI